MADKHIMNRINFIKSLLFCLAVPLLSYCSKIPSQEYSVNKDIQSNWVKNEHTFNKYSATIKSSLVKKKTKFIHISDTHISLPYSDTSEYPDFTKRMYEAYKNPEHYLSKKKGTSTKHFEEILDKAKKENVDFILLSGDILNSPSKDGVSYLVNMLKETGIEYLYIAGNHDWHFEGMEGSLEDLRNIWIDKRLKPLYKNRNPLYYSKIINGVNFVLIDNSTYQINKQQLQFFREQTELKYPIVLTIHIPIYQPEDKYDQELYTIGDPRWGYEYDSNNYLTEKRERWSKEGNRRETFEFILEVLSCKNLLGVFGGHHHQSIIRQLSPSAFQYLTQASFSGAYRMVEISPN